MRKHRHPRGDSKTSPLFSINPRSSSSCFLGTTFLTDVMSCLPDPTSTISSHLRDNILRSLISSVLSFGFRNRARRIFRIGTHATCSIIDSSFLPLPTSKTEKITHITHMVTFRFDFPPAASRQCNKMQSFDLSSSFIIFAIYYDALHSLLQTLCLIDA